MDKKLKILCISLSGLGHINAALGLCEGIKNRGHKVVFAVERSWKGRFLKYGFDEEVFDEREVKDGEVDGQFWNDFFANVSPYFRGDYEYNTNITRLSYSVFIDAVKYSNKRVKEIIDTVKPNVIIQDNYVTCPAIVKSGIPYVILWSANPLVAFCSPNLPPINSGEPIDDSRNWQKLTEIRNKSLSELWKSFNKWTIDEGLQGLKEPHFQYDSEHLNIVMYPKALFEDYAKRIKLGDNWMLLEHAVRNTPSEFRLPEQFLAKPGKVIYFSVGSMASGDVDLMTRMITMFSKSKHKFIVSLGAKLDEKQLPDNIWGQKLVPQLEVLKIADMFITHGGNNSLIEALYFAVPMIVMPLFTDQHSNAQRVVEMKLGTKMNPFTVTEDELLSSIDAMVNDEKLHQRLAVISNQLKNSNSLNEIVNRIEKIGVSK